MGGASMKMFCHGELRWTSVKIRFITVWVCPSQGMMPCSFLRVQWRIIMTESRYVFFLFEERDSQCNLWCHVKIVTQLGPHPQAYTSDWDPYQTGCHYVCIGLPVFVPQHKFLGTLLSHSVIIILFIIIIIMISWHHTQCLVNYMK